MRGGRAVVTTSTTAEATAPVMSTPGVVSVAQMEEETGHLGRGMNCDPSDVSEALEPLLPTSVYFTYI